MLKGSVQVDDMRRDQFFVNHPVVWGNHLHLLNITMLFDWVEADQYLC